MGALGDHIEPSSVVLAQAAGVTTAWPCNDPINLRYLLRTIGDEIMRESVGCDCCHISEDALRRPIAHDEITLPLHHLKGPHVSEIDMQTEVLLDGIRQMPQAAQPMLRPRTCCAESDSDRALC